MAHFILKHYPLNKDQRYTIIASPVWCKEDALQVVLDCTPGKRGLVVTPLSEAQKKQITVPKAGTNPYQVAGLIRHGPTLYRPGLFPKEKMAAVSFLTARPMP